MYNVHAFGAITNVNVAKRQVRGVLTLEIADKSNNWVMDYEASKPYFIEWSNEIHNATGGKSFGNLRLMHQLEGIGKVPSALEFDDKNKKIYCYGEVSDDRAWEKVMNGELCGFSWSGVKVPPTSEVLKRWSTMPDGARRYVGRPSELSLVDNPNQKGAYFEIVNAAGRPTFELLKEDGSTETREFVYNTALYDITDLASKIESLNYTSVSDEIRIDLNKVIAQLLGIVATMAKDKKDEIKVDNVELQGYIDAVEAAETLEDDLETTTTENAARGNENMAVDANVQVLNAAQVTEISNAAVTAAVAAIDFTAILTPIVNAALAPLQAQVTAIAAVTPAPSVVVTKAVDAGGVDTTGKKPEVVANAAQGISEKDAAALNKMRTMSERAKIRA